MTDKPAQRHLAAILVADVVGFSRLAEADEDRTLARLRALRSDLIDPTISVHSGRVVKRTGDGAIVEFRSVVDAVRCAVEVQNAMIERNAGVSPERRIEFRIGIHLGDVVEESDGDLMGDGVNIAARLEGIAAPGAICLSEDAYRQVKARLELSVSDLGETRLKNISEPMRVYSVQVGVALNAKPKRQEDSAKTGASSGSSEKSSIAVLPFAAMGGDSAQQYFADGLTEDIITELSRFRQFNVTSRNSSFRFRGTDIDMIRAGRELGVQYLLEGSVRRIGARIRVTAQLIDGAAGNHIWAERFDSGEDEISGAQDKFVRTIVGTLTNRLLDAGAEGAKRKSPASLTAHECVLLADALPFDSSAARVEARLLYEQAISLDPGYARAHALLAYILNGDWGLNGDWSQNMHAPDSLLDQAVELAKKSVSLDGNDSLCHAALGTCYLSRRDYAIAEHHLRKAFDLNPNRPAMVADMGYLYSCIGEPEKAIAQFAEARVLDSNFEPTWYWRLLGRALFIARRYSEAIDALNRSAGASAGMQALLAACWAQLENPDEARQHSREAVRLAPEFSIDRHMTREPFKHDADRQHLIAALRLAGLPE